MIVSGFVPNSKKLWMAFGSALRKLVMMIITKKLLAVNVNMWLVKELRNDNEIWDTPRALFLDSDLDRIIDPLRIIVQEVDCSSSEDYVDQIVSQSSRFQINRLDFCY